MSKDSLFNRIYPLGSPARGMIEEVKKQHTNDGLCRCGHCKDAFEAAVRAANQTLEHQCGYWLYGYALALTTVAKAYLMAHNTIDGGMNPDEAIIKSVSEIERVEEMLQQATFRHAELVHDAAEAHFTDKH